MTRQPRSPSWFALTTLVVLGLVGLVTFDVQCVLRQPPAAPAVAPPAADEGPASEPPAGVSIERLAGGQLRGGQWWFGYTPDPRATAAFLRTLPKPYMHQAAPELLRRADDKTPVLLYRALYDAYAFHHGGQRWIVGAQGIGDCVSWGWAHGCDVALAVKWKLGESSEWRASATEAIYGGSRVEARCGSDTDCRGGWGDGSYGGAAAKWVNQWGVLYREPYPQLGFDLTQYSSSRAKSWGNYGCGGEGDGGKADREAKTHPVRSVTLVRSFAEAAAAIQAGYPVPVCSGRGFSSQRDKDGFCRPAGGWSHCMCFTAVRFDRPGLLCQNSWGPSWVGGAKWPDDQPEGSFWVDADVASGMLSGGDSFAVSQYEGFPWRDLKHGDWVGTGPERATRLVGPRASWPRETDNMTLSLAP